MRGMKAVLALLVAVAVVGAIGGWAQQEHPREHPNQEHPKKEHPNKEHPAAKPITTADLEAVIKDTIAKKAAKAGGKFQVQDDVLNKTWALELVRVHTDKLTQLDESTYFACVDFKADDGTTVDVDFFLKNDGDKLKFSDTSVHKINGQARYAYQQKGGFWERVKAGN